MALLYSPFKFIFATLILVMNVNAFAQCTTCPAPPECSGGDGVVTNNANINANQVYWYSGNGATYSINFNGGTLVVCGELTISNMNFNGASTIYVTSTGRLTINSDVNFSNGATIYNAGTLTTNNSIAVSGQNVSLYNCSASSVLNVGSNLFINGTTSRFINFGTANIDNLSLQGGTTGQVCLGSGSTMEVNSLVNNTINGIQALSGPACLKINSTSL